MCKSNVDLDAVDITVENLSTGRGGAVVTPSPNFQRTKFAPVLIIILYLPRWFVVVVLKISYSLTPVSDMQ